ncbi:MAG: hypothetical protein HYU97_03005 [Deltaproteobacteria bacterium]|nr:hypothetical protein [Deltaproteobacteria bacterium]
MKDKSKRGPGRPWDKLPRVKPRIARSVRFPPEDYKLLTKAAEVRSETVEGFIKRAVIERTKKILTKFSF